VDDRNCLNISLWVLKSLQLGATIRPLFTSIHSARPSRLRITKVRSVVVTTLETGPATPSGIVGRTNSRWDTSGHRHELLRPLQKEKPSSPERTGFEAQPQHRIQEGECWGTSAGPLAGPDLPLGSLNA
jgi:hypothetical protein